MIRIFLLSFISFLIGCTTKGKSDNKSDKVFFNQKLADELGLMAEIDQIAAFPPQGKYEKLKQTEWKAFKDSVFTSNQIRAEEILDQHGYPGIDRVGASGSSNFWVIVQHSDFNPQFQKRVLDLMMAEVEEDNVSKSNYALLMDRYRLNNGQKMIYGTQVMYNDQEQAIPRPLMDSLNVNSRRAEMDLKPIEVYLMK